MTSYVRVCHTTRCTYVYFILCFSIISYFLNCIFLDCFQWCREGFQRQGCFSGFISFSHSLTPGHDVSVVTHMQGPFLLISSTFLGEYVKLHGWIYLPANAQDGLCLVHVDGFLIVLKAGQLELEVPEVELEGPGFCFSEGILLVSFTEERQKGCKALRRSKYWSHWLYKQWLKITLMTETYLKVHIIWTLIHSRWNILLFECSDQSGIHFNAINPIPELQRVLCLNIMSMIRIREGPESETLAHTHPIDDIDMFPWSFII